MVTFWRFKSHVSFSVLALLALAGTVHASPYTVQVSGIFDNSNIANPAQNSLAGYLGDSFSATFTLDNNPAYTCTQPSCTFANVQMNTSSTAAGWFFSNLNSTAGIPTVGSFTSNGTVAATSINQVLSNTVIYGSQTIPAGTLVSQVTIDAYSPDSIFNGQGTTITSSGIVSGYQAELSYYGYNSMLPGTQPFPTALPSSGVIGAYASLTEYSNSQVVGMVQLQGTVSGDYSGLQITSVPVVTVPEPDTWVMLLAGLGLVGVSVRQRKQTGPRSACFEIHTCQHANGFYVR
jgi:PEP-CTERM motif